MLAKTALFAALLAGGALLSSDLGATAATAPPMSLRSEAGADGSLVQKAQWGRCRYWHNECARRWGWGGWEFRRCLRRHDC
jgi:hypothetical protein